MGGSTTFIIDSSSTPTLGGPCENTDADRLFAIYERLLVSKRHDPHIIEWANQVRLGIINNEDQYCLSYSIQELLIGLYQHYDINDKFEEAREVKILLDRLGKTLIIEDFIRLVTSSETIFSSSEKNLLPTIQDVGDSFNHEVTHKVY